MLGHTIVKAQSDSTIVLEYNFNDQSFKELKGQTVTKPVGVILTEDRFGNENSALYLQGHTYSYLELGRENVLKPKKGTFSVWVKLDRKVYAGKGYEGNPFLCTRNSDLVDFYDAYSLFYDFKSDRLMVFLGKDSTEQTGLNSLEHFEFNKWYHLLFTYDNKMLKFYINGVKQGEAVKKFESVFLAGAPVCISNTDSKKNERYSRGSVDDIKIFHRVLNETEILELYNAPDPNRVMSFFKTVFKWLLILASVFLIAFLLIWQRRRALKREQEKLELKRQLHEMEIRTLKAQMNPHFIFNSLNSIQQLIMTKENDKAEEYLEKFSKLMRQLLESNVNESLTIKEEIEILSGYVEMEELRFKKEFKYNVEIDENIDQAKSAIPHLMIQPFLENAVWHGLLPKKSDKNLFVKFEYINADVIKCIIDDNGVGRKASFEKEQTFKRKSLGLSFVKQRLEMLSKTLKINCSIDIIDKVDENGNSTGTTVILVLPILKN